MKSPIDIVRGRIVDIDKHGIVTIKARYDDWPMLLKREYKECNNDTRKVGATEYWDDKAYRVQNGKLMKEVAHEMD